MSELKSAFEIEGFLEGKTRICWGGHPSQYYIKSNRVYICDFDEEDSPSSIPLARMLAKVWTPVPETKPKMYRHVFWYEDEGRLYDDQRSFVTDKTWEDWSEGLNHLIFIRTEEAGE